MVYVDGFVIPVPKKNIAAYKKMALLGAKIWKEYGALEYYECLGQDMKAMPGALSFPKIAKAKKGETVIFSWIIYKSKAHRNSVTKKVMSDKRMDMKGPMPFNVKKMAYGGFVPIVRY